MQLYYVMNVNSKMTLTLCHAMHICTHSTHTRVRLPLESGLTVHGVELLSGLWVLCVHEGESPELLQDKRYGCGQATLEGLFVYEKSGRWPI